MADVFISYSRKDKAFVQRLHQSLAAEGRDAWVDWEGIPLTADWWAEIQEGIEAADTFVFVISPDSAASGVCGQEIEHAENHNKRIVPIVYRDASPNELPLILGKLNWVFCRESDDFEAAFSALMDAMDTDLEWVKAHTRLVQRAVDWDKHNRSDSFVLHGEDLAEAEQMQIRTSQVPTLTELQAQYILASREKQEANRRQEWEAAQKLAEEERTTQEAHRLVVGLLIAFTVFFGGAYYWANTFIENIIVSLLQEKLNASLEFSATGIDGDELVALYQEGVPNHDGFTDDPRYWKQVDWLIKISNIDSRDNELYSYVPGKKPNEVIFIADSYAKSKPDRAAKFLDSFEYSRDDPILTSLQGSSAVVPVVYIDKLDRWLSAFKPIRNSRNEVVGGIGIDYKADQLNKIHQTINRQILIAFAIAYIVMLALIFLIARTFVIRSLRGTSGKLRKLRKGVSTTS